MSGHLHGSCVRCGKSSGLLTCNGCEQVLCFQHVDEHRKELDKQLEDLIIEDKSIREDLLNKDDSHELFSQIDQWRKESIEEIKRISKQAKEELRQLINRSHDEYLNQSKSIESNLQALKLSDDFNEKQLKQINEQMTLFKKQLDSFHLIKSTNVNFLKIEKSTSETGTPSPPPPIIAPPPPPIPNREETHSNQQGSVIISSIDPYGYYILIEHTGLTTSKDQDMVGWLLKRSIDSYQELLYRFPNDFILKCKSSIKILSKQASQSSYSYDVANCLIAETIPSWGITIKSTVNTLIDASGDQRDVFTQTFK